MIKLKEQFEQKLLSIQNYDEEIEQLRKQLQEQLDIVQALADKLTERRKGIKTQFEKEITQLLQNLGMPNANFSVQIEKTELTEYGQDKVYFLFSANKKVEPQPIHKIASGGELSRVMLAIKYIVSQSKTLPTIIFDEIDTGVSGEIAHKMGELIKNLSKNIQVIDITHLPQIAGKADTHLLVYKEDTPAGTVTRIKKLSEDERVKEIARMLSGDKITDAALEQAKLLINS